MTDKTKNLFDNLGRATLRGIRKCPNCGTFNGTRGISCKNKECRLIFKTPKEKIPKDKTRSEPELDAIKLCYSTLQIYSVKLQNGNNYLRCFVHLPIIEGIEALQDATEVTVIKQSAAMCYASSCRKPVSDMCTITLNLNPCSHTQLVVNCVIEAEALVVNKTVLKVLPIPEEMKQEIFTLSSKFEEHLVQRINKNTMVVKCYVGENHPLGFLHFSVFETGKHSKKLKILCECMNELTKPFVPKEKQMCLHFFLCICAFASDAKLLDEYKYVIQSIFPAKLSATNGLLSNLSEMDSELKNLRDFILNEVCQINRLKKETLNSSELCIVEDNPLKTAKLLKKNNGQAAKKSCADEVIPSITFEQWLASITERINQTMHYQFNGTPDPLVFQAPQVFFEALQRRISWSCSRKKRRLPDSVVTFAHPHTSRFLSKYTWHITNVFHVKRIFDTPEMPLEVTRSFIENRDGTYVLYCPSPDEDAKDLADNFRKTLNNLLIKPLELRTFLKVGTMILDQKESIPFIIEWIPDILPKTHVGELKITFQYGHQRNGMIEKKANTPVTSAA